MLEDIARSYRRADPSVKDVVVSPTNLLLRSQDENARIDIDLTNRRAAAGRYCVGEFQAAVVVNSRNIASRLTVTQLGDILRGQRGGSQWAQVGGSGGAIRCYLAAKNSQAAEVVRQKCMRFVKQDKQGWYGGWYAYRKEIIECADDADVLKQVKADEGGIGIVLYRGRPIEGVKVLAIGQDQAGALPPALVGESGSDYALSAPIFLCVPGGAGPAAKAFCRFAIGPVGSEIAANRGLLTPGITRILQEASRLADARQGKGGRVNTVAAIVGRTAILQLFVQYARAAAPIQVQDLITDSELAGIGAFAAGGNSLDSRTTTRPATGGTDLLLLTDRPSDRAMAVYGKQWEAMNPKEYVIGGRAVAVVVNKQVKADSLTMAQVRGIFTGEIDNWSTLGAVDSPSPRPSPFKGEGAGNKIKLYGVRPATGNELSSYGTADLADLALMEIDARGGTGFQPVNKDEHGQDGHATSDAAKAARDAKLARYAAAQAGYRDGQAAEVFYKEVAPSAKLKGVTYCKTTAEVLSAVAMDENAIGFVNHTDLLAAGGELRKDLAVKVLAVGPAGRVVGPSLDTIKNAMYPLSQRLYLYVHPQASDTAKDFAKFIATCGASAANPYTDVPGSVRQTFGKLGMVSLAPASAAPGASSDTSTSVGKSISATAPAAGAAGAP